MRLVALSVEFDGQFVLRGVGLEFVKGLNVVLGPNGSGKTTLLRSIIGMFKPAPGSLILEDDFERERSYAPAEYFPAEMSVEDVLLSGGFKKDYARYLKELGLEGLLKRNFATLSTGEKRLVLVAKALAEGNLVLMDEPTSGLDLKNQAKLKRILQAQRDKVLVVATHDINLAAAADRVTLLKRGQVLAHGTPSQVLTEGLLGELYEVPVKRVVLDGQTFFVT